MALNRTVSFQPEEIYLKITEIEKATGAPFSNVVCDLLRKALELPETENKPEVNPSQNKQ